MEQSFGEFERRSEQEQAAMGVRVLMREGQWIGDVPDALKARYAAPRDYAEEKPPMRLYPADIKRPKRHVIPNRKGTGRPRIKIEAVKRVRVTGRGRDWGFREDVTVDVIRGMQAERMSTAEIGEALGAAKSTVETRLREARKADGWTPADLALRVCDCGRPKHVTSPNCWKCQKKERQAAKTAAHAAQVAMRTCHCGHGKRATSVMCSRCAWSATVAKVRANERCACGNEKRESRSGSCTACRARKGNEARWGKR